MPELEAGLAGAKGKERKDGNEFGSSLRISSHNSPSLWMGGHWLHSQLASMPLPQRGFHLII